MWHHAPGRLAGAWWQVDHNRLLPQGRAALCSHQNKQLICYRFAFPACSASAKTTVCGFRECLVHHHGIPHSIAFDQEYHFTTNEMQQYWVRAHKIHWSRYVPHHLEATDLISWWNGLLKTQLQC